MFYSRFSQLKNTIEIKHQPFLYFREHPVFFMYMLVCLISIFKSYPSYSDVGLALSLLPLWRYVFQCKYRYNIYGSFMVFSATQQYFSYIMAVSFIDGGNRSAQRKPLS